MLMRGQDVAGKNAVARGHDPALTCGIQPSGMNEASNVP